MIKIEFESFFDQQISPPNVVKVDHDGHSLVTLCYDEISTHSAKLSCVTGRRAARHWIHQAG